MHIIHTRWVADLTQWWGKIPNCRDGWRKGTNRWRTSIQMSSSLRSRGRLAWAERPWIAAPIGALGDLSLRGTKIDRRPS